jgi:membrane-associated protease RseP (regulator of RpoE activity)
MKTTSPLVIVVFGAITVTLVDAGAALAILVAGAAITIVVGLHELAHLLTARLLGVRVLRYSIGFGPRLVARNARGISWELRALPFGGFVEIFGERADEGAGSFAAASLARRIAIIGAGPVSSILAAPLLCAIPFLLRGFDPLTSLTSGLTLCITILSISVNAVAAWLPIASSDPLGIPFSGLPGIAYAAGSVVDIGIFFAFAGALSLSTGLLNALPIPPLDGGRVAFALIRRLAPARGERLEQRVALVGIVAFLGLAAVLAAVDLVRIATERFPSA